MAIPNNISIYQAIYILINKFLHRYKVHYNKISQQWKVCYKFIEESVENFTSEHIETNMINNWPLDGVLLYIFMYKIEQNNMILKIAVYIYSVVEIEGDSEEHPNNFNAREYTLGQVDHRIIPGITLPE